MVTTEEQRPLWGLLDMTADARLVDEAQAFEVLCDAAEWSESAVEVPVEEDAPSPKGGDPDGELAAVRAFVAPGPRVERVLAALESGELPADVHAMLRHALQQAAHASGGEAVEKALARTAMAVTLPWRTHAPARFDPVRLRQGLDRTHAGLDRVKSRLVEALMASRRAGGLLTVEAPPRRGGAENVTSALLVRPRPLRAPVRVPCLAGPGSWVS